MRSKTIFFGPISTFAFQSVSHELVRTAQSSGCALSDRLATSFMLLEYIKRERTYAKLVGIGKDAHCRHRIICSIDEILSKSCCSPSYVATILSKSCCSPSCCNHYPSRVVALHVATILSKSCCSPSCCNHIIQVVL